MTRLTFIVPFIALLALAPPVQAQDLELPDYSDDQRWERLAFLMVGWEAAIIALGKEHDMTPAETGAWVGEFFSQGWLGGAEAAQFMRGTYRNFMSFPGAEAEMLSSTPTTASVRFNRPGDAYLQAGGQVLGVSSDDIHAMMRELNGTIADWVGVELEQRAEGDHDVLSMETLYGPIRASNESRWARGSYLSWLTWLQYFSTRMSSGATAVEVGAEDAEMYGPGWTARTPWALFRGMLWNQMSDPNMECEVLSASPEEVRAHCPQHYLAVVEQNEERFGVTSDDIFESSRAFAEGVAEQLGMRWSEELDDGNRVISVTRR